MASVTSIALLMMATAGTALAQSPTPAPAPATQVAPAARSGPPTSSLQVAPAAPAGATDPSALPLPGDLSEGTATMLSVGGTAVSWALIGIGAANLNQHDTVAVPAVVIGMVGTMFGPSLGHWYARDPFSRGFGLRMATLVVGIVDMSKCGLSGSSCSDGAHLALLGTGAALYIGGTIDDLATAPDAVRSYNRRIREVAIVPTLRTDTRSAGVALASRF